MTRSTQILLRLAAVALLVASATGCGARARFSVLRPAMLNARQFGGTMSVGPFEGDPMASAAIQQDLRQRIMTAEGNPVALIEGAGGLLIHGVVAVFSYSEQMQQSQGSCTRTVTDSQGNSRQVSYSCTNYTRIGTASVSIGFNITVPSTGQTIFANTYSDSSSARRTATDAQPVAINGGAMLENIRAGLTADFSRVILPWREIVRVTLGRCGDARAVCENGIAALRASDFAAAIASFQQAIQTLEGQPETNPVHLAEAHWNLGLAREYSGDFAGAVESIMRAAELDPSGDFNMELENVQRMAEDAQRLNEQGVTAN